MTYLHAYNNNLETSSIINDNVKTWQIGMYGGDICFPKHVQVPWIVFDHFKSWSPLKKNSSKWVINFRRIICFRESSILNVSLYWLSCKKNTTSLMKYLWIRWSKLNNSLKINDYAYLRFSNVRSCYFQVVYMYIFTWKDSLKYARTCY